MGIGIGAGLMLAMSAVRTGMRIVGGIQQAKAYKAQAKVTAAEGKLREEDRRRRMAREVGSAINKYAGAGVDPTVGSPVDVYADIAGEYAREQYADTVNTKNQVAVLKSNARTAQFNAFGNAVGQAAGGAYDIYRSLKPQLSTTAGG